MKCSRMVLWVIPLALALAAGGCSSNDNTINPEFVVNSLDDDRRAAGRNDHAAVGPRSGGLGRHHHLRQLARRRHDRPDRHRRRAFRPQGRGLRQQRVLRLSGPGLRQVGPLRPQEREDRRLGPAERDHGPVGRRRGQPRPGAGRLRRPDHVERDHRVGLFPDRGHRRRHPALHAGPGRRPGGLGHGQALRLRRHREHLRGRSDVRPGPRHVRRRHLRQRARPQRLRHQRQPWPPPTAPGAGASTPSAARTGRAATATTPL